MAFPTTGLLDDFNRADTGPPPSASWASPIFAGDDGLKVVSNTCGGNSTSYNSSYWQTDAGPDCEVFATITTMPTTSGELSLYLRTVSLGLNELDGYELRFNEAAGTDSLTLRRIDNASTTQLGATISQDFAVGEKIGFSMDGSTLRAHRYASGSWSELANRTDSTYTAAGKIGAAIFAVTGKIDDWSGGTMVAATPSLVYGKRTPSAILAR